MKKRKYLFLALLALLFLSSCGIPNMFVPDENSVSFIKDTNNNKASIIINSDYLKDSTKNLSYSPEVNLFYVIKSSKDSSSYSSLLSSFNSSYCNYPYCNPITGAKVDGSPLVEYKSGDTIYGLYQFFGDDSVISNNFFVNGELRLAFEFNESTGLLLRILNDQDSMILQKELRRSFDGDSFSSLSDIREGEELVSDYVRPVEVVVYATVTFSFTEYTNIWNTKISKELFSFNLD